MFTLRRGSIFIAESLTVYSPGHVYFPPICRPPAVLICISVVTFRPEEYWRDHGYIFSNGPAESPRRETQRRRVWTSWPAIDGVPAASPVSGTLRLWWLLAHVSSLAGLSVQTSYHYLHFAVSSLIRNDISVENNILNHQNPVRDDISFQHIAFRVLHFASRKKIS